jgi:hypothetical protein
MKTVKPFEEFINESDSPEFYDSNTDKKVKPKEKGWYVGYRTASGDVGFVKLDKKPNDNKQAKDILKKLNPDEVYAIIIKFAEVK